MANTMLRGATVVETLAATNSAATSAGFSMAGGAGALVLVSSVSGGASALTFVVKSDPASADNFTFIPDSSTTAVSQPISAGVAFELPGGLFAARWVIPVTNAGTASIRVVVKT